jgi:hypothetical protein
MSAKFWFQLNAGLACLWLLVASGWWHCPSGGDVLVYGLIAVPMFLAGVVASLTGLIIALVKFKSARTWAGGALGTWLCALAIDYCVIHYETRHCSDAGGYQTPQNAAR